MMDRYYMEEVMRPLTRQQCRDQLGHMIDVEKAYGKMLVSQGLLTLENYQVIADGLERISNTHGVDDLDMQCIDLYANLTKWLYEEVGEEKGCLLHVGRSRNDMGSTCCRMQVREMLWKVMEALNKMMKVLLEKAEAHTEDILTYYTYGQPAQPGTFGHYLTAAFELFARDFGRLKAAYKNTNRCPMGAAAGMGTNYPVNRELLSELLGFDSVIDRETLEEVIRPLGMMKMILEHCTINREKALIQTKNNFSSATAVAEYLAQQFELPFTETHQILKGIVSRIYDGTDTRDEDGRKITGEMIADISEEMIGRRIQMFDEEALMFLSPEFCVEYRRSGGTPKKSDTEQMIARNWTMLKEQEQWLEDAKQKVESALCKMKM